MPRLYLLHANIIEKPQGHRPEKENCRIYHRIERKHKNENDTVRASGAYKYF